MKLKDPNPVEQLIMAAHQKKLEYRRAVQAVSGNTYYCSVPNRVMALYWLKQGAKVECRMTKSGDRGYEPISEWQTWEPDEKQM